jgi:hypothetical protein
METKQPTTEYELISRINELGLQLGPVDLHLTDREVLAGRNLADGIIKAVWGKRSQDFVFEMKVRNTPKIIETACAIATQASKQTGLPPLIIVPFLAIDSIDRLVAANVSGVDLAGNGVLLAKDFSVWRSGSRNPFSSDEKIHNIYSGTSSIVARCFLLRPEFASLTELRDFALSRMPQHHDDTNEAHILAKGTISKVVSILEHQLLIQRSQGRVRISDARRLMQKLQDNYRPSYKVRVEGKTSLSSSQIWQTIADRLDVPSARQVFRCSTTGSGSAAFYNLLSGGSKLSLYVSDVTATSNLLHVEPTRVFPNVELVEEQRLSHYFDSRHSGQAIMASPVQVWLELVNGGPRERDAANSIEQLLLNSQGEILE